MNLSVSSATAAARVALAVAAAAITPTMQLFALRGGSSEGVGFTVFLLPIVAMVLVWVLVMPLATLGRWRVAFVGLLGTIVLVSSILTAKALAEGYIQ